MKRIHLKFCKKLFGMKKTTQIDFIYCELGRFNFQTTPLL